MPKIITCVHGITPRGKCRECMRKYKREYMQKWILTHPRKDRRNSQGMFMPKTCVHGITPKGDCKECKRIYDSQRQAKEKIKDYEDFKKYLTEIEKAIIEKQKQQKHKAIQEYLKTQGKAQAKSREQLINLEKIACQTTFLSQIKIDMSTFTIEALERILNDRNTNHLLRENSRIELRRRNNVNN